MENKKRRPAPRDPPQHRCDGRIRGSPPRWRAMRAGSSTAHRLAGSARRWPGRVRMPVSPQSGTGSPRHSRCRDVPDAGPVFWIDDGRSVIKGCWLESRTLGRHRNAVARPGTVIPVHGAIGQAAGATGNPRGNRWRRALEPEGGTSHADGFRARTGHQLRDLWQQGPLGCTHHRRAARLSGIHTAGDAYRAARIPGSAS